MDVKQMLRDRFRPIPATVKDPTLSGVLFIRRLRMPELQRYMDAVTAKTPQLETQSLLLSMAVCDADGAPMFANADEASELLGDLAADLYVQAAELAFGDPAGNSARATSLRAG